MKFLKEIMKEFLQDKTFVAIQLVITFNREFEDLFWVSQQSDCFKYCLITLNIFSPSASHRQSKLCKTFTHTQTHKQNDSLDTLPGSTWPGILRLHGVNTIGKITLIHKKDNAKPTLEAKSNSSAVWANAKTILWHCQGFISTRFFNSHVCKISGEW